MFCCTLESRESIVNLDLANQSEMKRIGYLREDYTCIKLVNWFLAPCGGLKKNKEIKKTRCSQKEHKIGLVIKVTATCKGSTIGRVKDNLNF